MVIIRNESARNRSHGDPFEDELGATGSKQRFALGVEDVIGRLTLSLSAGFCEEFIFRGYLIWVFQPVFGLWGAAAFSIFAFAMAHAYQGAKGILGTGAVGFLLTLVVLISGSLLPAIALHALVDIGQGLIAWLVLGRVKAEVSMVAALPQ